MARLTYNDVKDILAYDPVTGVLTWLRNAKRARAGCPAGSISDGYVKITIDYVGYPAQNIAWLLMTKEWPEALIDHKNLNRSDNRWENLRAASIPQNKYNVPPQVGCASKWKGVTYEPSMGRKKKWRASINVNGKTISRRFLTEAEAAEEYMFLALEHHGEFARFE